MQAKLQLYLDLIRWNRPAGWLLLLWPTLGALWLAAGGFPGWHLLAVFTLGTILMRSAGCCINDVADRRFDRHVKRTAQRPVTSGKISVKEALTVGAVLALAAFGLALTTNLVTILWSLGALVVTLIYPYAKRYVAMPQAVLGVAFSFGIPMAFTAVSGGVPGWVWGLVVGNLCWVLAYDTEYAMVDRDDDLKIGMKTSAITLGDWDVAAITLFYLVYLALWTALAAPPGTWSLTFGAASGADSASSALAWRRVSVLAVMLAAALAQVAWHYTLIRERQRESCFHAFRLNHWLGCTVFAGIVLLYAIA